MEPPSLVRGEDEEVKSFAPGTRIVLEVLRAEPEIVRVRSEGVHVLEIDLREWALRLMDALAVELERLGAEVLFASDAPQSYPEATLRVDLERIDFPERDGAGGVFLAARVASEPDGYSRTLASREAKDFAEAYQQIVRRIVDDPALRKWLEKRPQ